MHSAMAAVYLVMERERARAHVEQHARLLRSVSSYFGPASSHSPSGGARREGPRAEIFRLFLLRLQGFGMSFKRYLTALSQKPGILIKINTLRHFSGISRH